MERGNLQLDFEKLVSVGDSWHPPDPVSLEIGRGSFMSGKMQKNFIFQL